MTIITWLFEPGFLASSQVHVALVIGGTAAIVSGIVGVFAVMRGQAFAGHALTETSATGGSGALLTGVNPLLGFVVGAIGGSAAMEAVGARHPRGRDLASGVVLGAALGMTALFLYLTTGTASTAGATQQILFGSIFVAPMSTIPAVAVLGALSLGALALVQRPLLLATVHPDIAAARGIRARLIGNAYMVALASAVGLSSITIGAVLSTALLVGPAATSLRMTKRIATSLAVATLLSLGATWLGILLAYDSGDWAGGHYALPVSFFIVTLVFLAYLFSGLEPMIRRHAGRQPPGGPSVAPGERPFAGPATREGTC